MAPSLKLFVVIVYLAPGPESAVSQVPYRVSSSRRGWALETDQDLAKYFYNGERSPKFHHTTIQNKLANENCSRNTLQYNVDKQDFKSKHVLHSNGTWLKVSKHWQFKVLCGGVLFISSALCRLCCWINAMLWKLIKHMWWLFSSGIIIRYEYYLYSLVQPITKATFVSAVLTK